MTNPQFAWLILAAIAFGFAIYGCDWFQGGEQ